ncbi:MAG TPA: PmoA family protein [Prolixibacteraceae bacterium]|nr:PmoA family protein [Prolixibacteraceae bacterium]
MRLSSFVIFLLFQLTLSSQELLRFKLVPDVEAASSPVSIPLDGLILNLDTGRVALFEITGKTEKEVPCQLEPGVSPRLWFINESHSGVNKYVVRKIMNNTPASGRIEVKLSDKVMTVLKEGNPVLNYNHAVVYPPAGVDTVFKRSGFIHPLWSPGGEPLTRIQAPDHYHHYGIWNPWTETTIDGKKVDFWNLNKRQGTVRFAGYLDAVTGPVYGGFKVHQEHIYFPEKNRERLAIDEMWDVRVWNIPGKGISVVDLTTTLNTPLPSGIMLDAYRYGGGIGYRATEKWNKNNSSVLTSEGKTRADADGSNARWCLVEGETTVPAGRSGILFLSHPSNRKHPEPMRVWPLEQNGRGDLYFEFCPTRHFPWKLEPMNNYILKYRMIVFDGKMTPEEAERWWRGFAKTPRLDVS